ncbi:nuclear hormone receptor HR96 [Cimex lectularius]|uniref:Hormone receptor n=1 Tax=Cimex lectularius TaxID=79782 RepID=A0A8I6RYI6_CIMLE|nr:nuclear hormone receptor HR96 [Cimex lectularius]XP_014252511.1 nuclear hormone receptor HR96 [Cimex lectularius]
MDNEERRSHEKFCSVCGDQALGYNFNAVTCESCKAFFRRNATKTRELQCPFKQCCDITAVTRRFCQKCRLAKCFRVGMKRELIMTEADKERKKRKILANKARMVTAKAKDSIGNSKSVQVSMVSVEIGTQTEPLTCNCRQRYKADVPNSLLMAALPPPDKTQITYQLIKSIPTATLFPMSCQDNELLEDLIVANKALEAPLDQELNNLPGDEFKSCGSKSLLDVINLTALAIRRLIKMCKRIGGFRALCQEDQLTLLKQGCTQMMLLRSVVTFDPDRNSWRIPHSVDQMSQINVEVLKEARGNLYDAHEAFLRTFDTRASHDLNIMCILTAIVLFDPNRTNLVNKQLIAQQQSRYFSLLQCYLQSIYSSEESNEIYQHLICKMTELHQIIEEHVRVYLNVNPSQVEPILIEIFDLKTH